MALVNILSYPKISSILAQLTSQVVLTHHSLVYWMSLNAIDLNGEYIIQSRISPNWPRDVYFCYNLKRVTNCRVHCTWQFQVEHGSWGKNCYIGSSILFTKTKRIYFNLKVSQYSIVKWNIPYIQNLRRFSLH